MLYDLLISVLVSGRWSRQYIDITNPSDDTMNVETAVTNPDNFTLDVPAFSAADQSDPAVHFQVQPRSNLSVPIQFMPTTLGTGGHQATSEYSNSFGKIFICSLPCS